MAFVLNRRKRRLEAVIARVAGERAAKGKGDEVDRRKAIQQKLKEVEQRRSGRRRFRLREAIAQAGLTITPMRFVLLSAAAGLVAGLVLHSLISPLMGILGGVAGGIGLPHLALKIVAARRLKRFTSLFADAIDVVVRGVRSGLPIGECMRIIGREMPDPVGHEFRLVMEGIRLGMTVVESLDKMSERVPTPEARFFAIVVGIQQQTGGNLADTLAKLSDVLRSRKRMKDRVLALAQEAKTSAAIIGALPIILAGVLGLVAPQFIGLLFTTTIGHYLVMIGLFWMGIGIMVMRGMINFEM